MYLHGHCITTTVESGKEFSDIASQYVYPPFHSHWLNSNNIFGSFCNLFAPSCCCHVPQVIFHSFYQGVPPFPMLLSDTSHPITNFISSHAGPEPLQYQLLLSSWRFHPEQTCAWFCLKIIFWYSECYLH